MIVCPFCGNKNQRYISEQFDYLEDSLAYYEQAKYVQELKDLGYKIMVCDACCQAFIVKDD